MCIELLAPDNLLRLLEHNQYKYRYFIEIIPSFCYFACTAE